MPECQHEKVRSFNRGSKIKVQCDGCKQGIEVEGSDHEQALRDFTARKVAKQVFYSLNELAELSEDNLLL